MTFYSNPRETHPVDEAISVSNNRMFYVHQIADSNGVIIDPFGWSSSSSANMSDAFARLKVANPFTLGDYKHTHGVNYNFLNRTNSSGSVNYNSQKCSVTISSSTSADSYAIHQSKYYHPYQPGKSQEILISFVLYNSVTNSVKRIGYFDDYDGLFLEQTGSGELAFVVRSNVSGSPIDFRVPRSSWNLDKCDGTGDSDFDLDVTKTQLLYIDFQWLGVGRIRFGFVHNGQIIIAHEEFNSNELDSVYMSNPNLPIRSEVRNSGISTGAFLEHICSSVISSGGYSETGIDFAAYNSSYRTTPSAGGTAFPVLAIRLKSSFKNKPNRGSAIVTGIHFSVLDESILYRLVKLDSVSSLTFDGVANWTSADDDSCIEYCTNALTYTGGSTIKSGFIPAGSSQNSLAFGDFSNLSGAKKTMITQNYDSSDSEIYVVSVQTVSTGNNVIARVSCSIEWRERY